MSITRTCARDGCEVTFETYPADDQRHCSIAHVPRPAYRDSPEALRTCAYAECDEPFRARWPSDPKRFCTHTCSAAARQQGACDACGSVDDWYIQPNGKRRCRCRGRASWARKRQSRGVKVSARRLEAAERREQALRLRRSGATYDQIARLLDYSLPSSAYRAVARAMREAPAPLPVEIPAAPPTEPRPVWRPSAPGWPSVEHSDAVTR